MEEDKVQQMLDIVNQKVSVWQHLLQRAFIMLTWASCL